MTTRAPIGPTALVAPFPARPDDRIRHAAHIEPIPGWDWHSHPEPQWIAAGPSIIVLETEGAAWLALPGQALLVASDVRHDLSWMGAPTVASLYLAPDALGPGALGPADGVPCRLMAVTPLMQAAVAALIAETPPAAPAPSARAGLLGDLILDELSRPALAPLRLPMPEDRGLRRLCGHLRERPGDPRDVDACADLAGMSRRTFTRRFRQETGESFVEWRRRLRIIEALKLQARGEAAKRIAAATGYASVQALHAEARRVLGTPLKSFQPEARAA